MKGHQVMVLQSLGPTLACTTGQNTIGNTETTGEIQYCYNIPVRVYGLWVENQLKIHISLLCTPPGRRPGTAVGGERPRPGGGHSILGLPQDLHILGPEKKHFKLNSGSYG